MLEELAMAGATALLGAAATDAWKAARAGFARLLGQDDQRREELVYSRLDAVAAQLEHADPAERDQLRAALLPEWQARLHELLQKHPAAAEDLRSLNERVREQMPPAQQVWVQRNTVSGHAQQYNSQGPQNIAPGGTINQVTNVYRTGRRRRVDTGPGVPAGAADSSAGKPPSPGSGTSGSGSLRRFGRSGAVMGAVILILAVGGLLWKGQRALLSGSSEAGQPTVSDPHLPAGRPQPGASSTTSSSRGVGAPVAGSSTTAQQRQAGQPQPAGTQGVVGTRAPIPTARPVAPRSKPPAPPTPVTRQGTVNGCNTYGQDCDRDPIYQSVPGPGYSASQQAKIATVDNGTVLTARCWAQGGVTYNYAASHTPPDLGPNPYQSDIYFYVKAPGTDRWGYIPDTYFVHDKVGKLGLPGC
jgi:hypothetical protein